jgi:signal transduction histidine kinase
VRGWYVGDVDEGSELRASRSRLVGVALADRRRIERALHDGVQQDLIAISVRLQLARELVATAPTDALALLDDVQRDVRAALDGLRSFAYEIYPPVLDARGLSDALDALARASAGSVTVEAAGVRRYPDELEAAVYFVCRAALDGLEPGAEAAIDVRDEAGGLRLEIVGGRAVGLAGLRDLVEGSGGTLTVDAEEDGGARVGVRFPLVSHPLAER